VEALPCEAVAAVRIFHHASFEPAELRAAKGETEVSVCLPARDEAATVGAIVEAILPLVDGGLVDELVVLDDHSSDDTARVAADAGAKVVAAGGDEPGKGRALWQSVLATRGDVLVWCDADLEQFDPAFVTGLLGPLLTEPEIQFVKGFYDRPEVGGRDGGGRVTELLARPALTLLHPELASFRQPLSGEYAARRVLVEALPFVAGYGVDVGLLLDAFAAVGPPRMAQVDLGTRVHRNRSLAELTGPATEVLHAILDRSRLDKLPAATELPPPSLA
jgi:glucosyl-3-phosphoglycerate synthase